MPHINVIDGTMHSNNYVRQDKRLIVDKMTELLAGGRYQSN